LFQAGQFAGQQKKLLRPINCLRLVKNSRRPNGITTAKEAQPVQYFPFTETQSHDFVQAHG
jgi:hypothetical protein